MSSNVFMSLCWNIHSLFEIVSFTYNLWALVQNEPACLCIFLVEIVGVLATIVAGCGCGHFVPQLLPFYFVPCCSFPHFVQQSVPFYFVISLFSFPSRQTSTILYSFNNDLSLGRLVTQVADDTELVLPWTELADKWSEIMPHSGSCMFCNSYNMYILFALGNY